MRRKRQASARALDGNHGQLQLRFEIAASSQAALRALILSCPACGSLHDIKATDRQPRVFDREKQRFRCSRCYFTASVYVVVDLGVVAEEERAGALQ